MINCKNPFQAKSRQKQAKICKILDLIWPFSAPRPAGSARHGFLPLGARVPALPPQRGCRGRSHPVLARTNPGNWPVVVGKTMGFYHAKIVENGEPKKRTLPKVSGIHSTVSITVSDCIHSPKICWLQKSSKSQSFQKSMIRKTRITSQIYGSHGFSWGVLLCPGFTPTKLFKMSALNMKRWKQLPLSRLMVWRRTSVVRGSGFKSWKHQRIDRWIEMSFYKQLSNSKLSIPMLFNLI